VGVQLPVHQGRVDKEEVVQQVTLRCMNRADNELGPGLNPPNNALDDAANDIEFGRELVPRMIVLSLPVSVIKTFDLPR